MKLSRTNIFMRFYFTLYKISRSSVVRMSTECRQTVIEYAMSMSRTFSTPTPTLVQHVDGGMSKYRDTSTHSELELSMALLVYNSLVSGHRLYVWFQVNII